MNIEEQLKSVGPEWVSTRHGDVLVDSSGKIIGEVSKAIGNGYHALSRNKPLGQYISAEAAKRAVDHARLTTELAAAESRAAVALEIGAQYGAERDRLKAKLAADRSTTAAAVALNAKVKARP